jgi:hypothetical protein
VIIEVPGYGEIDRICYRAHGVRDERSLVVRANTRLIIGLGRGELGHLLTNLVIQDLVLSAVLLQVESAEEPDDI